MHLLTDKWGSATAVLRESLGKSQYLQAFAFIPTILLFFCCQPYGAGVVAEPQPPLPQEEQPPLPSSPPEAAPQSAPAPVKQKEYRSEPVRVATPPAAADIPNEPPGVLPPEEDTRKRKAKKNPTAVSAKKRGSVKVGSLVPSVLNKWAAARKDLVSPSTHSVNAGCCAKRLQHVDMQTAPESLQRFHDHPRHHAACPMKPSMS